MEKNLEMRRGEFPFSLIFPPFPIFSFPPPLFSPVFPHFSFFSHFSLSSSIFSYFSPFILTFSSFFPFFLVFFPILSPLDHPRITKILKFSPCFLTIWIIPEFPKIWEFSVPGLGWRERRPRAAGIPGRTGT